MNVQFSRSLGGFNREEVIEYIRKLTNEKHRAEDDAMIYSNKLDDAEHYIATLKTEFEEELAKHNERIETLKADISAKAAIISQLGDEIASLTEKLNTYDEEKCARLNPARIKAGAAEAAISSMAAELSELSERVATAHAELADALTIIDHYTIGADENGNF